MRVGDRDGEFACPTACSKTDMPSPLPRHGPESVAARLSQSFFPAHRGGSQCAVTLFQSRFHAALSDMRQDRVRRPSSMAGVWDVVFAKTRSTSRRWRANVGNA